MRIALLSLSAIADDPRIRRHGDALHAAGHEVIGVGLSGARSAPPAWEIRELPPTPRTRLTMASVRALEMAPPWSVERDADLRYRRWLPPRFSMLVAGTRADVYHANDWNTLGIAADAARLHRGRYVYDTHEFAGDEMQGNEEWERVRLPLVHSIEGGLISGAGFVMTVSPGIADALHERYRLVERPLVVRNVPAYEPVAFRPTGERVLVLYHGILSPTRNLEALIDSVQHWPAGYELEIRGVGDAAYRRTLEARSAGRAVRFVEPVATAELVRAATTADVGILAMAGDSTQVRFMLPNKLFEYVMAGLAVCFGDLPDVAAMVRPHGLGELVPAPASPEQIAAAVASLTRDRIDAAKRAALALAPELSWDREAALLTGAYDRLGGVRQRRRL